MISPVIMKGNKTGIRIIISEDVDMPTILTCLSEKLKNTGMYYENMKPISVTFEGKALTKDEERILLETLRCKGINVGEKAIIDSEEQPNKYMKPRMNQNLNSFTSDKNGLFYVGNLRHGQSITATSSIVIVGDVESGASVEAEGNIIVIGKLDGYAQSGINGKQDTFVYCLNKEA